VRRLLEPISIGTYTNSVFVFERLNSELRTLQSEGITLNIDVDKIGKLTFMDCLPSNIEGHGANAIFNTLKLSIANCLAEIIVEKWELLIVKKIVREHYYYYNDDEKQVILNKAKEVLNPAGVNMYHRHQRKEKVMLKILDYLELHKDLIVEGFINFRLKDYLKELEGIVNSAVDEFLLEKEYMEFIRLLKYFVDIQEPRIQKVQIVFKKNGKFSLLDKEDYPVKHESLDGLMVDLLEDEINYEDLLISALITLSPEELVIHKEPGVETGEAITTIQNVFGERAINCLGCKKCQTEDD
jgi:putative sporulation protein YtxC